MPGVIEAGGLQRAMEWDTKFKPARLLGDQREMWGPACYQAPQHPVWKNLGVFSDRLKAYEAACELEKLLLCIHMVTHHPNLTHKNLLSADALFPPASSLAVYPPKNVTSPRLLVCGHAGKQFQIGMQASLFTLLLIAAPRQ